MNPILRDLIIGLFPVVFMVLLYLHNRTKRKSNDQLVFNPNDPGFSAPIQPQSGGTDLVSKVASAGIKVHYVLAGGCGVALLVGVTYGAIVDSLARLIVVSTLVVMAVVILVAKRFAKPKAKRNEEP